MSKQKPKSLPEGWKNSVILAIPVAKNADMVFPPSKPPFFTQKDSHKLATPLKSNQVAELNNSFDERVLNERSSGDKGSLYIGSPLKDSPMDKLKKIKPREKDEELLKSALDGEVSMDANSHSPDSRSVIIEEIDEELEALGALWTIDGI